MADEPERTTPLPVEIAHPWQNGPAELIFHGIQHMHRQRWDFDRRIAFLQFDLGIETLFKTFLLLDPEITAAKTSHSARRKIADEGTFYELVRGVREAAPDRVSADDAHHLLHYHDVRNRLYHRGNGITVPEHDVRDYARLCVKLLRNLLDVDLADTLLARERQLEREHQIRALQNEIGEEREAIRKFATYLIDEIAPDLRRQEYDEIGFSDVLYEQYPDDEWPYISGWLDELFEQVVRNEAALENLRAYSDWNKGRILLDAWKRDDMSAIDIYAVDLTVLYLGIIKASRLADIYQRDIVIFKEAAGFPSRVDHPDLVTVDDITGHKGYSEGTALDEALVVGSRYVSALINVQKALMQSLSKLNPSFHGQLVSDFNRIMDYARFSSRFGDE